MDTHPVVEKQKISRSLQIFVVVCGLIGIVVGTAQCSRGVSEMFGADENVDIKKNMSEVNDAVDVANKNMLEAQPKFQKILDDVDAIGLAKVRQEQKAGTHSVMALFAKAEEQFRLASQKTAEAAQKASREKLKSFMTIKSQGYVHMADANAINQDIARMVQDVSITNLADLIAKAEEAGTRRDSAQKHAAEAEARAEAFVKDGKEMPK